MCLIAFAHQVHPDYPLLLSANRDEFRDRPTQRMHWWPNMQLLAGKDLQAGGTWLGLHEDGRWAAVTNYRDGRTKESAARSRGELCVNFLQQQEPALAYCNEIGQFHYAGFNLLLWDGKQLVYYNNQDTKGPQPLPPGVYSLSNALLDTSWPKVDHARQQMQHTLSISEMEHEHLQQVLANPSLAADDDLPDTGIPLEWERQLSACFIDAPDMNYGTRTRISLWRDHLGGYSVQERDFDDSLNAHQDFVLNFTK